MTLMSDAHSILFRRIACWFFMLGAGLFFSIDMAQAQGYVVQPESRSYACKLNHNAFCGEAKSLPGKIIGLGGFPDSENGPKDAHLASGGNILFSDLDEQSPDRWCKKTEVNTGKQTFRWKFDQPEATQDWRYYLTKANWDLYSPLTRASFELKPFCKYNGGMTAPTGFVEHTCNIPKNRVGYQVVLAVWDTADTHKSYYQAIDLTVMDPSLAKSDRRLIGVINPVKNLDVGDKVTAKLYDKEDNLIPEQVSIEINDTEQGNAKRWSYTLADAINHNLAGLRSGQRNAQGIVSPMYSCNSVYASKQSVVSRIETLVSKVKENETASISGLTDNITLTDQGAEVSFDVESGNGVMVTAKLFNQNDMASGFAEKTVSEGNDNISMHIHAATAGEYRLQVMFKMTDGSLIQQQRKITVVN
ncbi:N-acetylglucosamine-binding protein GbpA [Parashewanella spongiae]|uniref:N-acetylglucosamine-binding protein GbpA n=1 Tax=Parashewanella spongiae TaxID=342950 RepID=A0A3A6U1D1_9GAMM|nr:lytic polysaccharide monooxygenase [Parashewanella spongiae]MCL1079000.1 lytic polysaccharide monooxygenase [Parashewanella spongiae]RJY17824.1 N-acetylglucosamine-binding protein GbpA [Parashewanella spongiae]